jgi:hypothetical protein
MYAKYGEANELVAEAFVDVAINGKNANAVSKEFMKDLKMRKKRKY